MDKLLKPEDVAALLAVSPGFYFERAPAGCYRLATASALKRGH